MQGLDCCRHSDFLLPWPGLWNSASLVQLQQVRQQLLQGRHHHQHYQLRHKLRGWLRHIQCVGIHGKNAGISKLSKKCKMSSCSLLPASNIPIDIPLMTAVMQDLDVSDVGMEGEGLVFIVYSDAIASMPGSFFWAILFFFMLITLGVDRLQLHHIRSRKYS